MKNLLDINLNKITNQSSSNREEKETTICDKIVSKCDNLIKLIDLLIDKIEKTLF